ncbi:J domain-containing protein, partial [Escherichia coli]
MKNCWKILEIEETTDVDIIRRAYLALLSSFHPETDPQGFKQLRQAYEDALRIAQSPAKSVWQPEEHEVAEHEILLAFRALLSSDSERFLPSAWQRFIQQLNYCSMEDIDELRWSLCTIAMNTALNRPGFPGEYFICELRLPDHYFRWKHNKLFLLLPE